MNGSNGRRAEQPGGRETALCPSGVTAFRGGKRTGRKEGSEGWLRASALPLPASPQQRTGEIPLSPAGTGCCLGVSDTGAFQKLNLSLVFFFIETANTRSWKGLIKIIESNGVHAQPKCRLVPFLAPLIYQMLI